MNQFRQHFDYCVLTLLISTSDSRDLACSFYGDVCGEKGEKSVGTLIQSFMKH